MTIFASATLNIPRCTSNIDDNAHSEVTLNKSQLEGFISGDMDKATKMSFWDNIIDFFYPSYNKEEALQTISEMIGWESENANLPEWEKGGEADLLIRLENNFQKLFDLADDGTKGKFMIDTNQNPTKTTFKIDGHTIASANAITNSNNSEIIEEDLNW
ncbi:hypothetical protein [Shewanella surugensis]|uniref:Uncharacterized protein n=1 Tax=Shewanella surugensis TaxID=212020 RepID=A0ABT0L7U2_9GAMM|nr:hypothetical protein [Shewanella surugensis]MCL1123768.1 hypothetical protein [Shewanella surugensis]